MHLCYKVTSMIAKTMCVFLITVSLMARGTRHIVISLNILQ